MIIGAQKAGTSALHYYLDKHPKLIGSSPKELHYFDQEINYGVGINDYEAHFKSFFWKSRLFFESSPSYLYYDQVAFRLMRYNPKLKFIVVLRNPVDRAYSAWNMYRQFYEKGLVSRLEKGLSPGVENGLFTFLFKNRLSFPSFRECLEIELKIIGTEIQEPSIIRRGFYAEQLEKYLNYFSDKNFVIVDFEDLARDFEMILNRTCAFLDLEPFGKGDLEFVKINSGGYKTNISVDDREFLRDIYFKHNSRLSELIGWNPDW